MIIGLGIDLIEIDRIKKALEQNERFSDRILTTKEKAYFDTCEPKRQAEYLAGRFAAKEAFSKAVGTGIGQLDFTDIEILPDSKGKPILKSAKLKPNQTAHLSITHTASQAMAEVIVEEIE